MTITEPTRYEVTCNGYTVRVSRREYERAMSYGERQQRLIADAQRYLDWLAEYRSKHPHKPRTPPPMEERP